ncbi:MAG TPA: carboxypeptidase-like regulatory domain-containing protein [Mucilaginibacter sp.]|jgi:hypothetical protein|nr:carboxypeptidase-like regulatory domain-containing protein [Mucilaginibacter sp.]
MKKTLSILLLAVSAQLTMAQGNIASGSVRDASGKPLHFVFVGDVANRKAVFTDSLGNFAIAIKPDSKLAFELDGYRDTVVTGINTNTGLLMVLNPVPEGSSPSQGLSTKMQVETSESPEITSLSEGGLIAPGHKKGDLRGSQYLFDVFVHGYLVNNSGELVFRPAYLLDYDKVGGGLMLTPDHRKIVNVIWDQVQSFTLYGMNDQRYDFEKIPAIDQSHYVQVLASGPKYKICKLIKTKFVKSDYINNGLAAHGHDYDEYVDDFYYYVVPEGGQPVKLSLKKRSLKEVFAKDADKLNKFMSQASGDIDDDYLAKLGAAMNN